MSRNFRGGSGRDLIWIQFRDSKVVDPNHPARCVPERAIKTQSIKGVYHGSS